MRYYLYYKVSSPTITFSLVRLVSTNIYHFLAFAVGYDSHVIKTYSITCYLLNYKSECLKVFNSKSWHRERTGKWDFISLSKYSKGCKSLSLALFISDPRLPGAIKSKGRNIRQCFLTEPANTDQILKI